MEMSCGLEMGVESGCVFISYVTLFFVPRHLIRPVSHFF